MDEILLIKDLFFHFTVRKYARETFCSKIFYLFSDINSLLPDLQYL